MRLAGSYERNNEERTALRRVIKSYNKMIDCRVPFQPTGTNVVTNTAPTPGVRMRVVRRTGNTADVVGLGEDLQLRIEIDQVGGGGEGVGGYMILSLHCAGLSLWSVCP